MDLTRHEAKENMKHMKILCQDRHDKPRKKTHCKLCDHGPINTPKKEAKKHDAQKDKTIQAMDEVRNSLRSERSKPPTNHNARFYPGQRILWHLRHKIPGPGKFKIRWARPYLIKQV